MTTMTTYHAIGSVCGPCGHAHRSIEAAQRCADAHHGSIRRAYPSTYPTRAYSDRVVERCDGELLDGTPPTERELEDEVVEAHRDH